MQENTLSIVNDPQDPTVTVDFRRYSESENRTIYTSPSHQIGKRETLTISRTPAKVTGTFKGTRKTMAKFTTDVDIPGVDGEIQTVPAIVELSASFPVGMESAVIDLALLRISMFVTTNACKNLVKIQEI